MSNGKTVVTRKAGKTSGTPGAPKETGPRPRAIIVAMCLAHIASMTGFAAFPALLPVLQPLWALSNTEAGWINGIFFAGYVSAVPVMVSMTDRVDARRIYILGLAISTLGLAGFAWAAHDFWSGLVWHAIAGVGVGSTYMTGLKVMTDRLPKPAPSRAVAIYAAMFSTGAAGSFALNGAIGGWFGWQSAFAVSAVGPALAIVLALAMLRARPPAAGERPQTALLDFRPVLKNRTALGYMLGYAGHSWELFALRGWLVAFLVYAGIGGPDGAGEAAAIAAAASLVGVPSTIFGNELAQRFGRRRVILSIMSVATLVSCVVGFAASLPAGLLIALVFVYSVAIMGDSGSLTAGTAGAAQTGYGGATLALHSILGFGGAFFGPLAVGLVLDTVSGSGSGAASDLGWGLAFIAMGLGSAMGAVGLVWAHRRQGNAA